MASKNSEGCSANMNIEDNVLKEYHTWMLVENPPTPTLSDADGHSESKGVINIS